MRIERTGEVEPLTPRVARFLMEALGGVSMDNVESPEQRRIDYSCLRGLLAVELKTLEEDGSERMNNVVDELRKREDWPYFLGSAPMESVVKNMAEPDKIRLRLTDRAGRAIVSHVRKANDQFEAHAQRFPRKNQVRLLVLVNEDHELYEPSLIAHVASRILTRAEAGALRYPFVDALLYLTERHAQVVDGYISFPVMLLDGPNMVQEPWKAEPLQHLLHGWPAWNGLPSFRHPPAIDRFETIAAIPEKMPRHELWRVEYRRRPYLQHLTESQLRDRFDELTLQTLLFGVGGSPLKPTKEASHRMFEQYTHMMVEMASRAIPVTRFPYDVDRLIAAAGRLGLPDTVAAWLVELENVRGPGKKRR